MDVRLPRSDYIAEHKRLVDVLRNPAPAKLKAEAQEQVEDLRNARSGKR